MISHMPGHKGAENLRAQLRARYKKLEQEIVRKKKTGKSTRIGIKKEGQGVCC
jgi:ribosome-interacting GTPase 1